jgi:hypothetical protein
MVPNGQGHFPRLARRRRPATPLRAHRGRGGSLDRGLQAGLRAFDIADPDTIAERAFRNLAGYGPLEPLVADDDVCEIMINGPEAILSQ